jgi:hypothetical protein
MIFSNPYGRDGQMKNELINKKINCLLLVVQNTFFKYTAHIGRIAVMQEKHDCKNIIKKYKRQIVYVLSEEIIPEVIHRNSS